MTHHVASLHIVAFLGPLMRNVVDKHDTIARLGVQDDMLLCLAPRLKFGPVDRIKMRGLRLMSAFDKLEVSFPRVVVLKIEGSVDTDRSHRERMFIGIPLFMPIAVEIHVPLLQVGTGVDMRAEAPQLALLAH